MQNSISFWRSMTGDAQSIRNVKRSDNTFFFPQCNRMFSVRKGGLSCLRVFGEPAGGARLRVKRCVKRVPAADEAPRLHERAEKIKHRQQGWGGNRRRCRGGGRGVFISLSLHSPHLHFVLLLLAHVPSGSCG